MALATLSIDMVAKLASLEQGMERASRLSQKTAADIEANFKRLNDIGSKLGVAIGAAFSATVIRQFFSNVIDGIDALNDVADATGATVENISALDDVARRTGATLDVAASILVKFNNGLKEADGKNGVSQALKSIGLDAEQLKKIDPAEALRQTAVALAGFADDGNKARIIQELFGKSVKDAAPFLKDLSEQTRLNATVTKEAAEEAERFNKNIFALQANANAFGRTIVNATVPAINELIERFKEGSKEGRGFFGFLGDEYDRVARKQREFLGLQQGFRDGRGGSEVLRDLPIPSFNDRRSQALPQLPPLPTGSGSSRAGKVPEIAFATKDAQEYYRELFLASEKAAYAIEKVGESVAFGPEIPASVLATRDAYARLIETLPSAQMARLTETADELGRSLESGEITLAQFSEGAKILGEQMAGLQPQVEQTAKVIDEFTKQAQANIQDALGDTLVDTLKGNFDSIGQMWGDLILQMIAQATAAQLNKYLFGDGTKTGGGSLVNILPFLFSAKGNAFGPGGLAAFANGGVVSGATAFAYGGGRAGVMGEAGPEAILPLSRGRDGKLGVAGGGGNTTNITVAAGPTRSEVLTAIQQAVSASEARTSQRLRQVGIA